MMETLDLSTVERIVRSNIRSYRDDPRFEDAVQEALIRAWKDMESGDYVEDLGYIINRAKLWARSFLQRKSTRTTGSPPLSRDGKMTEQGEKTRQKIMSYTSEYFRLHNRKPSNRETAKALGLTLTTVANQRINIAKGHYDHAVYDVEDKTGRRRLAKTYFLPVHLDSVFTSTMDSDGSSDPRTDALVAIPSFEGDVLDEMSFRSLLDQIPEENRKAVYLHYGLGYSLVECSQILGITQKIFYTRMAKAKDEIRAIMDPDFAAEYHKEPEPPKCRNGHEKPDTGRCKECIQNYEKRRAGRKKGVKVERKPRTHCKRDHEIRGFKSGRPYCKVCNYMSQNPDKEIPETSKLWLWDERPDA